MPLSTKFGKGDALFIRPPGGEWVRFSLLRREDWPELQLVMQRGEGAPLLKLRDQVPTIVWPGLTATADCYRRRVIWTLAPGHQVSHTTQLQTGERHYA